MNLFPLLLGTVLYFSILFLRIPESIGLAFSYNFYIVPLLISFAYILLCYLPERISKILFMFLVLCTFSMSLSGLWQSGISNCLVIGGLLPFNDTAAYYSDALRLLNGDQFSPMSTCRPLSIGMLATILGLTSQNLKLALIIIVFINAFCCYLAIREVQYSHGYAAGLLMFLLLYFFYRRFIGTEFTENLGFATGCLGFAALWRGVILEKDSYCLLGIFVLTVSLLSRAGAFFILPFIVVWGTFVFRKEKTISLRFLFLGIGLIIAGFALNTIILYIVGASNSQVFSNYSYTLYGILTGGNWRTVYADHPEINFLSEPDKSRIVYSLALYILRENPLSLLSGIFRAWEAAFFPPYISFATFSFIFNHPSQETFLLSIMDQISNFSYLKRVYEMVPFSIILNMFCGIIFLVLAYMFSLISFIPVLNNITEKYNLLLIAVALGIFFSLPFAPIWDADYMRIYASTIPFMSFFPALGLSWTIAKFKRSSNIKKPETAFSSFILFIPCLFLITLCFIGPSTIKIFAKTPSVMPYSNCSPTEEKTFMYSPGSTVFLQDKSQEDIFYYRNIIKEEDYKKQMIIFRNVFPDQARPFEDTKSFSAITLAIDLKTKKSFYFFFKQSMIENPTGLVHVCGRDGGVELFWGVRIFYVDKVRPVHD